MQLRNLFSLLFIVSITVLFTGCSKSGDDETPDPGPGETLVDTVGQIMLSPIFYPAYDTSGNYVSQFSFGRHQAYSTLAYYTASNTSGTHYLRYVGGQNLFNADSAFDRGGEAIDFRIASGLKGKTIFEVYDKSTGQLYKKYVASKDSVKIYASFSVWDNYSTPNKTIGEALLYYINVKLTDQIIYRKNQ